MAAQRVGRTFHQRVQRPRRPSVPRAAAGADEECVDGGTGRENSRRTEAPVAVAALP